MENQEINLEKVHRLVDSLQSQATQGSTQEMLATAQLLVAELHHIHTNNNNITHRGAGTSVSVVMPYAGQPAVSHVPLEAPREPVAAALAAGDTALQAPTVLTEARPAEASDTHSFGAVPSPPAQIKEAVAPPVQKELFTLQELEEEVQEIKAYPAITPLRKSDYPTSIPGDTPILQDAQNPPDLVAPPPERIPVPPAAPNIADEEPAYTAPQQTMPSQQQEPVPEAVETLQTEENKRRHLAFISDNFSAWADYGMSGEAPTLVQNQPRTGTSDDNNSDQPYRDLNEQLGQPQEEWAHKMQSTPIENLASAIGVNDRYLYISELFRGDESMYERSIITLNKFNSFQEAHAWSERELRLKLGWDTQSQITQQFEQLIKRRFMQKPEH